MKKVQTMSRRSHFILSDRSTRFFLISNTFIGDAWLKLEKIKQKLGNTLRLNFCYLKIVLFSHRCYHSKKIGDILKNEQKNKHVCLNEVISLMTMKMRMKMKKG